MFTPEQRARVRERVLGLARADSRSLAVVSELFVAEVNEVDPELAERLTSPLAVAPAS